MVVMMGNSIFGRISSILIVSATLLDPSPVYESVVWHVITPNLDCMCLNPFAYSLYFKQMRGPMMRCYVNGSQQLLL